MMILNDDFGGAVGGGGEGFRGFGGATGPNVQGEREGAERPLALFSCFELFDDF